MQELVGKGNLKCINPVWGRINRQCAWNDSTQMTLLDLANKCRIGAVTSAQDSGISDANIQMLGRWKCNAYKLYIRTLREDLAKLLGQLVAGPSASGK